MLHYKANLFITLTVLVLISLFATSTHASDMEKVKALHDANCLSCHKSIMSGKPDSIYVRKNRRINSYSALQNQVNRCESNIGISWSQKQIDGVIEYLNQQFYKFKK